MFHLIRRYKVTGEPEGPCFKDIVESPDRKHDEAEDDERGGELCGEPEFLFLAGHDSSIQESRPARFMVHGRVRAGIHRDADR